jgi:DsbC/DsbD-like thiol-disulfide interchange protein
MKQRMALVLIAALVALSGVAAAQKGPKNSEAVVKVGATAENPDANGKQTVTVTLDVDKGWHTYANPVGLDDLENAQTVVEITSKTKPESVQVEYPKGKLQKDNVVGDYSVYEGKVTIKATVQRAKGDREPLEVKVTFQACSDKSCLSPATVKRKVESP